ncbi:carboxypeptidase-like regulatory domain-containing protein [Pleomorphovibrio marinus]|uniref:carboxypeptidase-like regulatory domain-containing protein n=1 Tax=Pleomorphovibrio marinus TaxID=2164132 RepID=UPI000E0B02E8|nr:carboxypeptidase-like regulatory domain-containing protein [Pleomorphovibrio marinus]
MLGRKCLVPGLLGLLFFILGFSALNPLLAQRISLKGRIVDGETHLPLPYVTVFVNNTSEGTVANEDGEFELKMAEGHHELVLSLVGYENLIYSANFTADSPRILFQMAPKLIDLNELEVHGERSKEWYENLKIFEFYFLGNSKNALSCKIINPEVLVIDFDQSLLKVHSTDFLIIENHRLGYRINYLLTSFELDNSKKIFHFLGYPSYTEMEGGKWKQRRWKKNRSKTYLGSWLHFKRNLLEGTIHEAGFEVRKMKTVPNPDRPEERIILDAKEQLKNIGDVTFSSFRDSLAAIVKKESLPKIINEVDPNQLEERDFSNTINGELTLEFEDYLEITYTLAKASREYINSMVPGKVNKSTDQVSILKQTAPVSIYSTGLESNPLFLYFEGYWGWQKLGDFLPTDYEFSD